MIAVGPAAQYQAARLTGVLPYPLLLDPELSVQRLIGVQGQSSLAFYLNVRGWLRYLASFLRHRRQGRITGRRQTLPGVAIVSNHGDVLWLHQGRSVADYPKVSVVLDELREHGARQTR
ncbi:MAG: hypothetical protein OES13_11550 [Acidimicrobiia bacterium]|nr:hypothetical protein [Acidimicrobiia bacterium]